MRVQNGKLSVNVSEATEMLSVNHPKCPRMAISISELAEVLGVSRPTAYEIVRREDFDGLFYIGRKPLVSVAALQAWIAKQTEETA